MQDIKEFIAERILNPNETERHLTAKLKKFGLEAEPSAGVENSSATRNLKWQYVSSGEHLNGCRIEIRYDHVIDIENLAEMSLRDFELLRQNCLRELNMKKPLISYEFDDITRRLPENEAILIHPFSPKEESFAEVWLEILEDVICDVGMSLGGIEHILPEGYDGFLVPRRYSPADYRFVSEEPSELAKGFIQASEACFGDREFYDKLKPKDADKLDGLEQLQLFEEILANQSYNHPDLTGYTPKQVIDEMFDKVLIDTLPE